MTCTTDELLQVMQKLLSERQKVKTHDRKATTPYEVPKAFAKPIDVAPITQKPLFSPEVVALQATITTLKNEIAHLTKEKEQHNEQINPSSHTESADISALKQSLYQAQREIRTSKEHAAELEEEIKRLIQFRSSLQIELKEQTSKLHDFEKIRAELVAAKAKASELEKQMSTQASSSVEGSFISKENLLSERHKREELELFIEDQKLIFIDLTNRIKELEKRIETTQNEKQKLLLEREKFEEALSHEKYSHTSLLLEFEKHLPMIATYQNEKAAYLDKLNDIEKKLYQKERAFDDLSSRASLVEKNLEALENERKSLLELTSSHKFELDKARTELEQTTQLLQQKETLLKDQEFSLSELEEHLLRRVEQCTELKEKNELLQQELSLTKAELSTTSSDLATKEQAFLEEIIALEEQLNHLQQEAEQRNTSLLLAQERIAALDAIATRYRLLEKMIKDSYDIISQ